jgi:hypothetical protein
VHDSIRIGRAYFDKNNAEGKTRNEAMSCLERRLVNRIWWLMVAVDLRLTAKPPCTEIAA